MYCPSCGKSNSQDQKFCRACGLNLEGTARSVSEQLPAVQRDEKLNRRKILVEKALTTLLGVGLTAFMLVIIFTIITKLIIAKGDVWSGIGFIVFLLGAVAALLLVIYRESLVEATAKRPADQNASTRADLPEPQQLADMYFEPARSVTESTTDLLEPKPTPAARTRKK